jgi:hypothetical protein
MPVAATLVVYNAFIMGCSPIVGCPRHFAASGQRGQSDGIAGRGQEGARTIAGLSEFDSGFAFMNVARQLLLQKLKIAAAVSADHRISFYSSWRLFKMHSPSWLMTMSSRMPRQEM